MKLGYILFCFQNLFEIVGFLLFSFSYLINQILRGFQKNLSCANIKHKILLFKYCKQRITWIIMQAFMKEYYKKIKCKSPQLHHGCALLFHVGSSYIFE